MFVSAVLALGLEGEAGVADIDGYGDPCIGIVSEGVVPRPSSDSAARRNGGSRTAGDVLVASE